MEPLFAFWGLPREIQGSWSSDSDSGSGSGSDSTGITQKSQWCHFHHSPPTCPGIPRGSSSNKPSPILPLTPEFFNSLKLFAAPHGPAASFQVTPGCQGILLSPPAGFTLGEFGEKKWKPQQSSHVLLRELCLPLKFQVYFLGNQVGQQGRAGRGWSGREFCHCSTSCGRGRKHFRAHRENLGNGNCSGADFLSVPGHHLPTFPLLLD